MTALSRKPPAEREDRLYSPKRFESCSVLPSSTVLLSFLPVSYPNPESGCNHGRSAAPCRSAVLSPADAPLRPHLRKKANFHSFPTSIIKNLDQLAKENINFSATNNVGGFYTLNGTTWTSSALLALTSGINYKFPIIPEDMKNRTEFAENVVSIGNILDETL